MKNIIATVLDSLRKTQFLPVEQLVGHQHRQLEQLVRHARVHVPFYRRTGRLEPLFRSDGTIDWTRWNEIPPLTRIEVQQAGDALRAEFLPSEHGRTHLLTTSGSTGEPVSVWHTELSNGWIRAAVLIREYEQHGVDVSQRLASLRPFSEEDFDIRRIRRQEGWIPDLPPSE